MREAQAPVTSPPTATRRQPAFAVPLALIAIVVVIAGLRETAWLVTPAFSALVVVILVHPVRAGLRRLGVPSILALTAMVVLAFGMIIALVAVVLFGLARLATVLPEYATSALDSTRVLADWLTRLGLGRDQIRELAGSVDILVVARWLTTQLPPVLSVGTGLVVFYTLVIFASIESAQLGERGKALARDHPRVASSLVGYAGNVRRYFAITGVLALIVGALDAVFLLAIGIPHALLWGLLAAACNFIPYVGFVIGLVPPALLALLGAGWQGMVLVIVVYVVLNSIITTLVPAKVVGDAVGMSMTSTILSVIFWAWVLGPLGAVLAIPLSLLVKALFVDDVPSARWLAGFVDAAPRKRRAQTPLAADHGRRSVDGSF